MRSGLCFLHFPSKVSALSGSADPPGAVDGFSPVYVEVENSYTEVDEGKVVVNGRLANQTSITVNENKTYDTTQHNQVTVEVPNAYTYTAQEGDHLDGKDLEAGEDYIFNENGFELVPDSIGFLVLPPSKIYEEGESISLGDAVVVGYKKAEQGGQKIRWEGDENYPNGVIPHVELNLSPIIAEYD